VISDWREDSLQRGSAVDTFDLGADVAEVAPIAHNRSKEAASVVSFEGVGMTGNRVRTLGLRRVSTENSRMYAQRWISYHQSGVRGQAVGT
jgi:hypothetical protein